MKNPLAFYALLAGWIACANADVPPAEQLLPADTLIMLTVPDATKARELYQQSPQAQLWRDPAMKPLRDKFMEKLNRDLLEPLQRELGVNLTNYLNLLQGQLTFALTQNGWQGKSEPLPGWLFLLDSRTNSNLLKTNLTELKRKWADANKPFRTEKIRGTEFTVLLLSSNDVPQTLRKLFPDKPAPGTFPGDETNAPPAPKKELYLGQTGSVLLVGNSPRTLDKALAPLTGGQMFTLGELSAFEANRLMLFRDATFFGWANAKKFIDIWSEKLTEKAIQEASEPSFTPYRPEKVIGALGLNALRSIAFSFHQTSEGGFFDLFLSAPETEREGLLKVLAGDHRETAPPLFVPADVAKFYRWRMDGQKTWTNLEKTLNTISPQILAGLNFAFEMAGMNAKEKDPNYDLKKNLLNSLGNDLTGYQKKPRSTEPADLVSPPSIFLLGSPQPEKMIEVLKNILTAMNRKPEPPKEREFLGRKIYSFQLAPQRLVGGERVTRTLNVSSSSGYVALSMDAATLEEFLRSGANPAKPLRETPGFAEAAQKVTGSGTSWLNYENQSASMRMTFELLKKNADRFSTNNPATPLGNLSRMGGGQFLREWVDFSLLPDFDRVAKYFYFAVSTGNASAEGLSLKLFTPRPPQLKQ